MWKQASISPFEDFLLWVTHVIVSSILKFLMDQLRVTLERHIKLFGSLVGQLDVCPEVCNYVITLFAQQSYMMTALIPMSGKMLEAVLHDDW